jgi:predicted enzyme related to lactoylglutathione lyase
MPRPVHFEIHADDPGRARAFYEAVFGWSFQQWGDNPYWVVSTGIEGPGIDGGLLPRQGPPPEDNAPVSSFVITIDSPDIDKAIAAIEEAGGRIAVPKDVVPGVGWLAYAKDTEGNIFGVLQADESAAQGA